jgi:hypothetical protein
MLLFWWKASSAPANQLQFYIGSQLVNQIAGKEGGFWSCAARSSVSKYRPDPGFGGFSAVSASIDMSLFI